MTAVITQTPPTRVAIPAPSHTRPALWRALVHTLAITRRNLLQLVRSRALVVLSIAQPIMFVLLFNYALGGAITIPGTTYIDFIVPGLIVQFVTFTVIPTGIGVAQDMTNGIIDRFRSLPMTRSAVLTGRILADTVRSTFNILLLTGVGTLIGFRITTGPMPALAAFLIVIAFGFALSWVAVWMGVTMRSPEAVQVAGFLWVFPLIFASSIFVPVQTMPSWLQAIAEVSPVTTTADAVRALLLGGPTTIPVLQTLAWTIGILTVFATLAIRRYNRIP